MSKINKDGRIVAVNRKARADYELVSEYEAGIILTGTEVKSLRTGKADIAESYISAEKNEIWLINAQIQPYDKGNRLNHEPKRNRKLLLRRSEITKLTRNVLARGMSMVPLRMYFTKRGYVKITFALAKGLKRHDKRNVIKQRDWDRQKHRLLKLN